MAQKSIRVIDLNSPYSMILWVQISMTEHLLFKQVAWSHHAFILCFHNEYLVQYLILNGIVLCIIQTVALVNLTLICTVYTSSNNCQKVLLWLLISDCRSH